MSQALPFDVPMPFGGMMPSIDVSRRRVRGTRLGRCTPWWQLRTPNYLLFVSTLWAFLPGASRAAHALSAAQRGSLHSAVATMHVPFSESCHRSQRVPSAPWLARSRSPRRQCRGGRTAASPPLLPTPRTWRTTRQYRSWRW